jgi:hypothetical protein
MTKKYLRCYHHVIRNGKVRLCRNKKCIDNKNEDIYTLLGINKFECNKHRNTKLLCKLKYIHCIKQTHNHEAKGNRIFECSSCVTCNKPVRKIIMITEYHKNKVIIKYDYNDVTHDLNMKLSYNIDRPTITRMYV